MTARRRLVALQRTLALVIAARALLIGAAVALAGIALARAASLPSVVVPLAALAGIVVAAAFGRRVAPVRSLERVALWVEERHPALRYALVAAAEREPAGADVERQASHLPWWDDARRTALGRLLAPAAALAVAGSLALWGPALVRDRAAEHAAVGRGARTGAAPRDLLAHVQVTVAPPAYTGRATISTDDPTGVDALVGSTITVAGAGDAALVRATLDSTPRAVAPHGGRWSLTFPMPARPALLRLRSSSARERLLVLAPVVDAPPAVTLLLPARDTVVRAATGVLALRAILRDDIGLRDAAFEVIVSSGQEESFTFRGTTLARTSLDGRTDGALEARLSLDSLALKPGDVVQLRAVAHDGNTVAGGFGSSETRALRVARAGEYDSVAVDAAPPGDPEGQVLSQRMLITLAEALERRRGRLSRGTLFDESRRIALDQRKLRKRVGDVVFQRTGGQPLAEEGSDDEPPPKLTAEDLLRRASEATGGSAGAVMDVEGDETPILAVNRPLLEAFNAMWDAGRSLEQGEPAAALPPMRRALAAIQRARQAERIYLRGRPIPVIVDVVRARLAGKDKGASVVREPRPAADPVARRRGETFARATALLAHDPSAAADSLLVLRVAALGDAPALAAALDDAVRILRRGDAAALPLAWARARRALSGAPVRRDSLPVWSGAP